MKTVIYACRILSKPLYIFCLFLGSSPPHVRVERGGQSRESLLPLHIIFLHSALLCLCLSPDVSRFHQKHPPGPSLSASRALTALTSRCRTMTNRVSVALLRLNCVFLLAASHVESSEADYLFPDAEQGLCFHAKKHIVHILRNI